MYQKQIRNYAPICAQERSDKNIMYHYVRQYPHNILTRQNEVAHMTSSGFIMNRELTKVLFIFHKLYQSWGWTGGHNDGEADCLKVAIKEAKEETGLTSVEPLSEGVMSMDILPVWGHERRGKYVSAHLHLNVAYVLLADENDPLFINHDETEGVQWIDVEEIDVYSVEPDLNIVYKKLVEAARKYDPNKQIIIGEETLEETQESFGKVMKDTAVPIAVHEAKSAYYKAMLVKEVGSRGVKGILQGGKKLFKKK